METRNLLVELLVEELPPKSLRKLGDSFAHLLSQSLIMQQLALTTTVVTPYATPRRLAVHLTEVLSQAPNQQQSHKLMPVAIGLDSAGQATPALIKKMSSLGMEMFSVSELKRAMDGKTEALYLERAVTGTPLVNGLQTALEQTMSQLPIPKVMTYQLADGWSTVNFVRPVHSLIALYGTEVVAINLMGLTAGNITRGHRFEAKSNSIAIQEADSYAQQLQNEGAVVANFAERRQLINGQLIAAANKVNLNLIPDETLLDEVTALVEHPNVLMGQFAEAFLEIPQECLILTMKANQKYFPLFDQHGKLANRFLLVSNICPNDPHAIIDGNERVVRSRLADAKFFFDQDRKKTLISRLPGLNTVIYHHQLGTQGLRIHYLCALASKIGAMIGGDQLANEAAQATKLAKADLLTDMVGEFPELQGIMGRYYAQHEGLSDTVAYAIEDHYKPRYAGDVLPRNLIGVCVALADKLETLVNLFAIGQIPTGDKDPYALRRHALGVIRILIEKDLPIELNNLLELAFEIVQDETIAQQWQQATNNERSAAIPPRPVLTIEIIDQLRRFISDRLAGSLREQGYTAQEVDAVLALNPQHLNDIPKRLAAVRAFSSLPEAASLAAANKRVSNILKKVGHEVSDRVNSSQLCEEAEKALHQALLDLTDKVDLAFKEKDYVVTFQILAELKTIVDAFFDHVMVNVEDEVLRANRLALLKQLQQIMNRVADISKLAS
ncbi:MAG: glycine--tRNA ligase subunit beta [Nitrosomonas sp.]|nr:glycine--tRNA ligase subunit beta [Nitrosomonas sp.]MBK7363544.1 glycine--tRNA ligase subunit beta [Nitrosomonas sp.]